MPALPPLYPDPEASTANAVVVLVDGIELTIPYRGTGVITIGRSQRQDIAIPAAAGVSKLHALLRPSAQGWDVVDCAGKNGLLVGQQRVVGQAMVHEGSVLRLPADLPTGQNPVELKLLRLPDHQGAPDTSTTVVASSTPTPLLWISVSNAVKPSICLHLRSGSHPVDAPKPRQIEMLQQLLELGCPRIDGRRDWKSLTTGREEKMHGGPGSVAKHRSELRNWWSRVRGDCPELAGDPRYEALISSGSEPLRLMIPPMDSPA